MVRFALVAVINLHAAASGVIGVIASVRKAAEITQVEFAERLGKPQSFVSKVERGERGLDVIEFCQVAEALGNDPAKLLQAFRLMRRRSRLGANGAHCSRGTPLAHHSPQSGRHGLK